ncbi:hypothetical protein BTHI11S_00610 [Bosea thiooxidans]
MSGSSVPAYWLYGERLAERFPDALHIEPIVARSSLHGWTIQPHLHHDLFQFFLVTRGGGRTRVDGRDHRLEPGSVLLLPPRPSTNSPFWKEPTASWPAPRRPR